MLAVVMRRRDEPCEALRRRCLPGPSLAHRVDAKKMARKGYAVRSSRAEEIAAGREDGDEPQQASGGLKSLHGLLAPSQGQMRVLRPFVELPVRAIFQARDDPKARPALQPSLLTIMRCGGDLCLGVSGIPCLGGHNG